MRPQIHVENGDLVGLPGRNPRLTVYRGVPFAAPPVGELRWRPPEPPVPWSGVRHAGRFGAICPQVPGPELAGLELPMDEDCLRLNVWTPTSHPQDRLPVLVWFFGGGFRVGAGANPRFDGEALAAKGVVVVTLNYRLGALGFLATPELSAESQHAASGNYGLLDCNAALRWIRDNISAFGGDPGRVTIAGQSAGAGIVNFLAMSPLAAGLFHRAIAQSHARYSRDPELRYLATSYRTLAGAERDGVAFMAARGAHTLAEQRALPWQKLIGGLETDESVDTRGPAKPPLFRPVVDGWVIPDTYQRVYEAGRPNNVDYLVGSNRDEGGAVPEALIPGLRACGATTARAGAPPTYLTAEPFVTAARAKFGDSAEKFLRLYPAGSDDEAAASSSAAVRDNARVSTYWWVTQWRRHTNRSVYTYFWTHRPPGPAGRRAAHGSEIDFVFDNLDRTAADWTDEDRAVAETISSYWVNFIATGNPNGQGLPSWEPYRAEDRSVMELGEQFAPTQVADPDRFEFWSEFFQTQQSW